MQVLLADLPRDRDIKYGSFTKDVTEETRDFVLKRSGLAGVDPVKYALSKTKVSNKRLSKHTQIKGTPKVKDHHSVGK